MMGMAAPDAAASDLGGLLKAGAIWLERRGIEDARLQCEWLAAEVFHCSRTALPLREKPSQDKIAALRQGVVRLGGGEPIQYVVGNWDFRTLTLKTDERALIPRPETEGLVQLVLDEASLWRTENGDRVCPAIYDVGTGTGAIALSLVAECPGCRVTAVDCEASALSLARENAAMLGLGDRVQFILGRNCAGAAPGSLDAVVSNPPYIASREVDELPRHIRDFEPRTALDGGLDGLDILRSLIHDAAITLKKGGCIFLEIGDRQGPDVQALLENSGFSEAAILKDFAGRTRYARGRIE